MKKKPFDLKKLVLFGGIPAAIIAILTGVVTFSKTVTAYADLPKKVDKVTGDIGDIKEYIKQQQAINNYIHNKEVQAEQVNKDEPTDEIMSEDGRKWWDSSIRKWRPVEE